MIKLKAGGIQNLFRFLKASVGEISQITWPTKRELIGYLIAVVIVSAIITAYIYGLDKLFITLQIKLSGIR